MNKTTIPIIGMHCRSCEILIEDELKQIPGVQKIKVDRKCHCAEIHHVEKIEFSQFELAIKNAGYRIGQSEKPSLLSTNPIVYRDFGISFFLVFVIFFLLQKVGLFNIKVGGAANYASLPLVLLVGLTAGFSTCMALVGGLVLGISSSFAKQNPESSVLEKFKPHLFFNLGRIGAFFILGGVIGMIGGIFQLSPLVMGVITIAVGIVMLLMGLQLTEISPKLAGISLTIPKSLARLLGIDSSKEAMYSPSNTILMGGLTFFLPCGFTQAMQLYAISTGSFLSGALTMGIFAIGTSPGLLGIGGLTSLIKGVFAKRFFKFVGVVVIFMALFNMVNGFNLTGLNFTFASTSPNSSGNSNATIENGYQIIRMTQTAYGYSPNNLTVKKGLPVKWIIDAQDANSCSASILAGKLGIRQNLNAGENIIEFTSNEAGQIKFSCSMGMYTGIINVIE